VGGNTGVLSSKLFTGEGIDDSTRQRLEGCALGGNETLTHIAHGQRGQHVRRVQEALSRIRESDPSLGIPSFSVNGVYDPAFAHAVYVYKQRRSILNYRGQIDDIVGTKTIRSLDLDLQPAKPKVQPSPTPPMPKKPGVFPKPDGPGCVKDENCPTSQSFTVQVLTIVTAGEFLEGAVAQFRFRNTQNLLTADYEWTAFGVGPPGPPLNANVGGAPAPFTTRSVRITRFGPNAIVIGGNPVPIHGTPSFFFLTLSFREDGSESVGPTIKINTGQNPLAGGGAHKGSLKLLTTCRFAPGAFLGLSRPVAL
jgi:hypothetical protein